MCTSLCAVRVCVFRTCDQKGEWCAWTVSTIDTRECTCHIRCCWTAAGNQRELYHHDHYHQHQHRIESFVWKGGRRGAWCWPVCITWPFRIRQDGALLFISGSYAQDTQKPPGCSSSPTNEKQRAHTESKHQEMCSEICKRAGKVGNSATSRNARNASGNLCAIFKVRNCVRFLRWLTARQNYCVIDLQSKQVNTHRTFGKTWILCQASKTNTQQIAVQRIHEGSLFSNSGGNTTQSINNLVNMESKRRRTIDMFLRKTRTCKT